MKWLYLLRYLYKKFMQMINLKKIFILVSMMLFVITCILSACDIGVSVKKNEETESIFIPEAANQFAVDKETETEAIEETKAHHIYPDDFKMVVDKEVVIGEKNFLTKIDYIYKHIDDFAQPRNDICGCRFQICHGQDMCQQFSWHTLCFLPCVARSMCATPNAC